MPTLAGPLIMGMSSVAGAVSNASAMRAQGAYQKSVAETNAAISRSRSEEARAKGEQNANAIRRRASKIQSEQRASAAAQGQDPDSGTFADLAAETQIAAAEDIKVAKTNAWMESWGYETESLNATAAGQFAGMAAENQARSTLLTGGMQALGYLSEGAAKKARYDKEDPTTKKGEK